MKNIDAKLQDEFRQLCSDKYLQSMIDFIAQHRDNIDVNAGFAQACCYGEIQVAKHLLDHENADIHTQEDYAVKWACINNHNKLAKYLLNSSELNEHADIETAFSACCTFGNKYILDYLVLDHGLEAIHIIQKVIEKVSNRPTYEYTQRLIEKALLKYELEEALPMTSSKTNKVKI